MLVTRWIVTARTLVHIIPAGIFDNSWQGSWKDTVSRIRYFESRVGDYRQVRVIDDDLAQCRVAFEACNDVHVLIEYSTFPKIVKWIRQTFPSAFIAVRAHNIEPLQHLDNHGWRPKRGTLWMLYGMARLMWGDLACKRHADAIYSISEWEKKVYWNRMFGAARVEWLPYYCPDHLRPAPSIGFEVRSRIACLPSSSENRKSRDLVERFLTFAQRMAQVNGPPNEQSGQAGKSKYECVVTGDLSSWNLAQTESARFTGMVEDLSGFLSSCAAVAMLSPLGYGFKTTVEDAIAHGCYVLAHPALARRCPSALAKAIIPVDLDAVAPRSLSNVPVQLTEPFPVPQVDSELRGIAWRILGGALSRRGSSTTDIR